MKALMGAAAALLLVGAAAPALAAATANDSSTVTAKIIRPISVSKTADLAFGTIVKPTSGSSDVTIATGGGLTITGADAVSLGSTAHGAAQFTVSGEGGQAINMTVPGTFDLNNTTTSGTLTVTTSNDMPNSGAVSQALSGGLGSGGTFVVKVGGKITVTDATNTGDYSGTLTVTAAYQ